MNRTFQTLRNFTTFVLIAAMLAGVTGCSTAHYPINASLSQVDPSKGYRLSRMARNPDEVDLFVVLTFSGGGTRAAALAYGVLEELARQKIVWRGQEKRLLDEVDLVYGVSGGSITAAYWALFGDKTFTDFESQFLTRDLQSQLIDSVTSFSGLWLINSRRFGRGELLAARLDEGLFRGATFADLVKQKKGPLVVISATDLSNGSRFDFTQDYFDLLCSNLDTFPIARAVAASSAVPVVFAPVSLWNYANTCGFQPPERLAEALDRALPRHLGDSRQQQRALEIVGYLDVQRKPYVHLVDGGVADNLAVRGVLEIADASEDPASKTPPLLPRKVLFITVDAGTDPSTEISKSADIPSIGQVVEAISDIPIQRFSSETRLLLQASIDKRRAQAAATGRLDDVKNMYLVEVSLRSVPDSQQRKHLMRLPTSLQLAQSDVRSLRDTAAKLIRESPDFQRLVDELGVRVQPLPMAEGTAP
jgi:NTE family protein